MADLYESRHTGAEIDDAIDRAKAGGDIDQALDGKIPASEKGTANGVAELGEDGKVPASQLPDMDYIPTSEKGKENGVATLGTNGKVPADQVDAYPKSESDTLLLQKLSGIESAEYPGCYYRMDGTAVEWFDPPLISGVEYRTTERYLGKPVYIKMWDTGALPNATYKEVAISISDVHRIIDFGGDAYQDATHLISLPCWKYGADSYTVDNAVQLAVGPSNISIATKKNMSTFTTSHVWIKYTKTTD